MKSILSADKAERIAAIPLFRELDERELAAVAGGTRELQLEKHEMLFQKGDPAKGFFLVLQGQIKLSFPSVHGQEKIVDIIGPSQTFGEAIMFLGANFPVRAVALTQCELLLFDSRMIFDLLERDPGFTRKLLAGMSQRLHQLVRDVELYSQRSSVQRLIGYLLQSCPDDASAGAAITVDLPTSKQVIASRLNLTPETLSRILHTLDEQGLIEMQGRRIHIPDIARLRDHDM